ncbi:MAG: DUF2975 domain-containing protein [Bacteroidota bacterium]
MKPIVPARTRIVLTLMHIGAWIAFIGLSIDAGALLTSLVVGAINPDILDRLYPTFDLVALYQLGSDHFFVILSLITLAAALKAYMFYLLIMIAMKINFIHPFSLPIYRLIARISLIGIIIWVLVLAVTLRFAQLTKAGLNLPDMDRYLEGGSEYLLFAGMIFLIAQVFKRGIEIQLENELTV